MTLAKKREQQDEAFVKHLVDTRRTWNDAYEKRGWGRPWSESEADAKEFLDIK